MLIFNESTTIGVRISEVKRKKLARETKTIKTKYGQVNIKIGRKGKVVKNISPSYDDCKKLAQKLNIPLKEILEEANKEARNLSLRE